MGDAPDGNDRNKYYSKLAELYGKNRFILFVCRIVVAIREFYLIIKPIVREYYSLFELLPKSFKEFIVLFIIFIITMSTVTLYDNLGRHDEDILKINLSEIKSIHVLPVAYSSLVSRPYHLNGNEILEIQSALKTAETIRPNHPNTQWGCNLRIITAKETISLEITKAYGDRNGLLIWVSNPRMMSDFKVWRCDRLGDILENIAADNAIKALPPENTTS
ncbi:MAG: hypothetical protein HZB23_11935 [Deltaproteobacteria bacterium]|nr:hypothetical protein [Deltaproteobacteria bacterium]